MPATGVPAPELVVGEPGIIMPFEVVQLCDIVAAEFEPLTNDVSVMLPVMVLVLAEDPLLVGVVTTF